MTGVDPKSLPAVVQAVQEMYRGCLTIYTDHIDLKKIKEWRDATGIEPSEETVQAGYRKYAEQVAMGAFRFLRKIISVRPNLPEAFVQEIYQKYFGWDRFYDMAALREETGVIPEIAEETVQAKYSELFGFPDSSSLNLIDRLRTATGIEPRLPEEDIQHVYEKDAKSGIVWRIKQIREITGIEPSEKVYQTFISFLELKN